jgi:hypothetical protein
MPIGHSCPRHRTPTGPQPFRELQRYSVAAPNRARCGRRRGTRRLRPAKRSSEAGRGHHRPGRSCGDGRAAAASAAFPVPTNVFGLAWRVRADLRCRSPRVLHRPVVWQGHHGLGTCRGEVKCRGQVATDRAALGRDDLHRHARSEVIGSGAIAADRPSRHRCWVRRDIRRAGRPSVRRAACWRRRARVVRRRHEVEEPVIPVEHNGQRGAQTAGSAVSASSTSAV